MGIQYLATLSFTQKGSLRRALSALFFVLFLALPALAADPGDRAETGSEGAPSCNPYEGFPDCCPAGQAIVDTFRDLIVKGDRNLINPSQPLDILYPADNYGANQPTPRHYNTTGGGHLQTYGFVTRASATPPAEAPSPLACYGGGGTYNEYICGRANLMTNSKAIIDPSISATCPRWDDFNNHPDLCLTPAEHIANYDKILDGMRALDCASAVHAAYQLSGMLGPTGRDASVFLTNSVPRMVAKTGLGGQTVYPSNAAGVPFCNPDKNWEGCQCGDVGVTVGNTHVVMYSGRGTILHSNYSRSNGNGRPDINGNSHDGPHEDRAKFNYRAVTRFVDCSPGATNNVLRGFGSSCSTYRLNAEGQCVPTPCVGTMTLYNNLLNWRSCYNPVETVNTECLNAAPPANSWGAATLGQLLMGTMPTVPACYATPKTPRFTTYQISAIADFLRNARNSNSLLDLISAIIELLFRSTTPTSGLNDPQANDRRIGAFYEFQAGTKSELGKNDADISSLLQTENRPPSYGCKNVAINKKQLSEQVDRYISNWMFRCSTNSKIQLTGKPEQSDIMDGECVRRYAGSAVLPKAPFGTDESMCQPLDIAAPTKRNTPVPAVEAIYDPTHPFGFRRTGIVGTYNNDTFSKKYNANVVCDRTDPANLNDLGYPVDILMSRKSEWDACIGCHANCFRPTDYDLNSSVRPPPLMQPQCSTCRDDCCDIIEKPVNEERDNVILNVLKLRPTPFAWEKDVRWPDWEWIFWRNFGTSETRAKKPAMTWWDTNYASCRYPEDTLVGVGVEHENCGYGGWEELKLYQANCMKYFRLGCICRYEQTFKEGSSEEYVHRRSGAVYWDFKEKTDTPYMLGSGTRSVESLKPVPQQWPLAWRGYAKHGHATLRQKEYGTPNRIAMVSKRFPFLGLKPDPNFPECLASPFDPEKCLAAKGAWYDPNYAGLPFSEFMGATDEPGSGKGLSKAKPGDIIIWDDEVIRKNNADVWDDPDQTYTLPDMLPHVAIVQSVHPKYVVVEEYNYGEFPDSCGNTTMWHTQGTRELYRKAGDIEQTAYTKAQLGEMDCRNSKLKKCEEKFWDKIKIYRPWRDNRRGPEYGCNPKLDLLAYNSQYGMESTLEKLGDNFVKRYPKGSAVGSRGMALIYKDEERKYDEYRIYPYKDRRGAPDMLNNIANLVPGAKNYNASVARAKEIQSMIYADRAKGCDAPLAWMYETHVNTMSDEIRERVRIGEIEYCYYDEKNPKKLPRNCYPRAMTATGTTSFFNTTPQKPGATDGPDASTTDENCGRDPNKPVKHDTSYSFTDPRNPINPGRLIPPNPGEIPDGSAPDNRPPGNGSTGNNNPPEGGGSGSCTAVTMAAEALTDPQAMLLAAKDIASRASAIAPNARNVLSGTPNSSVVLRELVMTGNEGTAALLSVMPTANLSPSPNSTSDYNQANAQYTALATALSNPGTASAGAMMASSTKATYYMSKGLVNETSKIITRTLSACGYTLPPASVTAVSAKLAEATAAVNAQSTTIGGLSGSTPITALNQALTNAVSIADSVKSALETVENQLRANTTCLSDLAADRCRTNPNDCFIGDISLDGSSSMGDRPAGCSNPPNILTDNPACFRDGITSGTGGLTPFCKEDGTLSYTPGTPADPFKPIADRTAPEYREEGYSNDYVVEQLESVAKPWLNIRETVTSGTETVQSTRREILLGIPPKDWELYPFVTACRVANPAATGSLQEKQTVAVIKSSRYPLGQAAVVWRIVPNAAGGPCVQLRASNWAAGTCTGSGGCQTQLDQRNCYQSYPYFGLACTTLQCVPLSDIDYFFNPTPNCGVPPGVP